MNRSQIQIIGIDCATEEKKVGIALGYFDGVTATIDTVTTGSKGSPTVDIVTKWLSSHTPTLIALDAPLGWPTSMGIELSHHEAGQIIQTERNKMFRRRTDEVIREKLQKTPLDVGADRIARTAHAALTLLNQLRQSSEQAIPLAWEPGFQTGSYAIEVYPAATLRAHGYKVIQENKDQQEQAIMEFLKNHVAVSENFQKNRHAVDAVVCVLAGVDFLKGAAIYPEDEITARKEGWIWARRPI